MESKTPTTVLDGITFPESPRWYDNRLWLVDVFGQTVLTLTTDGDMETLRKFDDLPSGMGFLPGGIPLVVLMRKKQIVRVDTGAVHADLSDLGGEYLNDMVVDDHGRAYVGHVQFPPDKHSIETESGDSIVLVEPDGSWR